jgi:hypothetical protein
LWQLLGTIAGSSERTHADAAIDKNKAPISEWLVRSSASIAVRASGATGIPVPNLPIQASTPSAT